ncbi:hypothetical protein Ancab_015060 [Ancistrocladus abbreviatus]
MAIAAASISPEGIFGSTSCGGTRMGMSPPFDARRICDPCGMRVSSSSFGSVQHHWLPAGRSHCSSKVWIASDFSNLVPDSSDYVADGEYYPLEEVRLRKRSRVMKLNPAELARTTLEANTSALLVFPGMVHCELHECVSWAEYQYRVDDFGDIYFQIFNDENILQDHLTSNTVNALFGMDIPFESTRAGGHYDPFDIDLYDANFDDDYLELVGSEISGSPAELGTPDTSIGPHPVYFAKCLTKAVNMEYSKRMDHPTNGVSIMGLLRPCFLDEEPYTRRLFYCNDSDDYLRDWEDEKILSVNSRCEGATIDSTFYRLEITRIDLYSVYGIKHAISLDDFLDAEPDALVHSTSAIVKRFSERGIKCDAALKALCKRKGLVVEGANFIGVDSLGIDVRVCRGVEVRTYRFPFKVQATSEGAAEKQIQQLLFPRSHRKKLMTCIRRDGDADSF